MSEIREYVGAAEQKRVEQQARRAVQSGLLVKPSVCSWCGAADLPIHGHHPDYARPLMVVWVCARCHKQHHDAYAVERRLHGRL